jgi:hypothetical protein
MMYGLSVKNKDPSQLTELHQDLANFLLVRGPYAWLGHGWHGCSKNYPFPHEFSRDYGKPLDICAETAANSGVFTRKWTNVDVTMDCNKWTPSFSWKKTAALPVPTEDPPAQA